MKGTLKRWNAGKGFGFIKPEIPGSDVFVHISALKHLGRRPVIGDVFHYQTETDKAGRTRAVNVSIEGVAATSGQAKSADVKNNSNNKKAWVSKVIYILIAAMIGSYILKVVNTSDRNSEPAEKAVNVISPTNPAQSLEATTGNYSCEGKTYCSEMRSCGEAMFYLQNCPDTKLDGDDDGIPCAKQWCNQ